MELGALILGIMGNIQSTLVMLVPMKTFWGIFKKGTSGSFSPLPYVAALLCNMLWLYYGILDTNGTLIITISALACTLEGFYLFVYMRYATPIHRKTLIKQLLVIVVTYPPVIILTMLYCSGSKRLQIVGLISTLNSICMYAAPLSIVGLVIKSRSVEYMPFLLSLSLFISGGIWFGYGLLMKDLFLEISNGTGLLLGSIQLVVYAIFYKNGSQNRESKNNQESNNVHTIEPTKYQNQSKESELIKMPSIV